MIFTGVYNKTPLDYLSQMPLDIEPLLAGDLPNLVPESNICPAGS